MSTVDAVTWLRYFYPQVAVFLERSNQEEARVYLRNLMFLMLRKSLSVQNGGDTRYLVQCIRDVLYEIKKTGSNAYNSLGVIQQMALYGYVNIRKSTKNQGAWSRLVDIGPYNEQLGKIMKAYHRPTEDPELSAQCYAEAVVGRQLEHPNLVEYTDIVIGARCENKVPLMMGEICFIQDRHPMDLEEYLCQIVDSEDVIKSALLDIAHGLAVLHDNQILHRDIKPSNVLVDQHGKMKVCDFGLSVRAVTQQEMCSKKITIWYRPPELMVLSTTDDKLPYGTEVDMWSFGMLILDFVFVQPFMYYPCKNISDDTNKELRYIGCVQKDVESIFTFLIDAIGVPPPNIVESWRKYLGTEFIDRVECMEFCESVIGKVGEQISVCSFIDKFKAVIKPEILGLPHKFVESLISIVLRLLVWDPAKRLTAVQVMNLLDGDVVPTLPPRKVVPPKEWEWRRDRYTYHNVVEMINRAKVYIQAVCQDDPITSPIDILVLSTELFLRTKYRAKLVFNGSKLHTACVSIAIQLTFPYLPHWYIYDVDRMTQYEGQQLELFVAHTLNFNLYIENIVTESARATARCIRRNALLNEYIKQFP